MRKLPESEDYPLAELSPNFDFRPVRPLHDANLSNFPEYRTLSIHVSDTISHGVPPAKGPIKTIAELDWHMLPSQETLQRLGSSETQGLDNNQAQRRLQQYGKNVVSPPPTNHIRKTYVCRNVC